MLQMVLKLSYQRCEMEFKVHATSGDYESWTVKEFLEHELNAVRELNDQKPDPLFQSVIEYLEKRLSGEIR